MDIEWVRAEKYADLDAFWIYFKIEEREEELSFLIEKERGKWDYANAYDCGRSLYQKIKKEVDIQTLITHPNIRLKLLFH